MTQQVTQALCYMLFLSGCTNGIAVTTIPSPSPSPSVTVVPTASQSPVPTPSIEGCPTTGPSGALTCDGGYLDIETPIVPLKPSANEWTGVNYFDQGIKINTPTTQPTCAEAWRGTFWFLNEGAAKDSVEICVWSGNAYLWIKLY